MTQNNLKISEEITLCDKQCIVRGDTGVNEAPQTWHFFGDLSDMAPGRNTHGRHEICAMDGYHKKAYEMCIVC